MYPQQMPEDVASSAERLLYQEFQRQLPDTFIVMYSVKWLMRDRTHHDRDGEIDFLIVHRALGLLVLEVKGGRIRIDSRTRQWYTMDRDNHETLLKKSPFDQARDNLYALKSKLEEVPKTRPYIYRLQRGVAFPNVVVDQSDIGLYGDREIVIDSTDLGRLEATVKRIMGSPEHGPALSEAAERALVDTLEPSLEIRRIGLGAHVIHAEQQIDTLTQGQFAILDALRLRPHAVISGCAGSGKTMLAMEKARRLANEGFAVLFTCFNKNLAHWARCRFAQDPYTANDRIYVAHYHALAQELCRRAGIALPSLQNATTNVLNHYYMETLPNALIEALTILPIRFDAIIVDEGQDFAEGWWVSLLDLLKDREYGVFYIFYDNNQQIYPRETILPISDPPFLLTLNCRNTDKIHEEILRYYRGTPKPTSRGPVGITPECRPVAPGEEHEALRQAFAELFTQQRLPYQSVVVLSPLSARRSMFAEGERLGNVTLTWDREPGPGQVQISSIYGFKGLEAPIVILVELDKADHLQQDELIYVAFSRARDHLIVLGNLPKPQARACILTPSKRLPLDV